MTNNPNEPLISDHEFAEVRHALNVMRTQVRTPRVDTRYFERQFDKLEHLIGRMENEHRQLTQQGRFEMLYNVSRLLGSSLDLQTVLDQVMDAIIQLTKAERGFLMLRDDDGQIAVVAARNFDQQTLIADTSQFSRTIVNQVMDSGEPIVTTNASEDPRFNMQESIMGRSLRSIMATPLRARGMVIGAAYVENQAIAGLFQNDDLTSLETFAGQAAVAIDNAQLFSVTDQKLAARLHELSQLRRIDMQLNETLDADKAMALTLEWVCRVCNADIGHFGLVSEEHVTAKHHYCFPVEDDKPLFLEELYPAVMDSIAYHETLLVGEDHADSAQIMIVPARRENKVIAAAVLVKTQGVFTEEQRDLVERIIARAAVAIENGVLYAAVKAADLAKSEFVGIVAHDLKVPMTSIVGYADLTLMDGGLTEEQNYFQSRIRDTVQRMEILVSDLADISRIESGHFYMTPTRIKVGAVLQGVHDNVDTQIEARSHHYVEEIEPNLPALHVDYYRLLQVLTNLVSNAYKYTPNGGTITLAVRAIEDRVQFSVSDTGIGLKPEQIKQLGKKFWRASDEFTRSQPGTGLGFAITRALVEQMGSQIEIQSEAGKGSTFTFSVPISLE
ncbi:MAG: ATP-binding protein [Anaerolineae bacterium]